MTPLCAPPLGIVEVVVVVDLDGDGDVDLVDSR
jgi:hypothetical protein